VFSKLRRILSNTMISQITSESKQKQKQKIYFLYLLTIYPKYRWKCPEDYFSGFAKKKFVLTRLKREEIIV